MHGTRITCVEDQPTTDNLKRPQADVAPTGEVRAAMSPRLNCAIPSSSRGGEGSAHADMAVCAGPQALTRRTRTGSAAVTLQGSKDNSSTISDLPTGSEEISIEHGVSQDLSTMAVEPPPGWCPAEGSNELPSCVLSLYRRDHTWRARKVPYALAGRDETGYEAAVPDRTASHEAPAASSFLYLISASG